MRTAFLIRYTIAPTPANGKTISAIISPASGSVNSSSKKIKETLINTSADNLHKLLKAKILSLLLQKDKNSLMGHPKCNLRNFIVTYEGKEYVIDARLNLNLENKNIKDITKIKGLNNLTHLVSLDLRNNHLSSIIGIGNLINLRKLRLRGNNFSERFIEHLGGLDRYGNDRDPLNWVKYSKRLEKGGIRYISVGTKNLEVFGDELHLKNMGITKISEIKGLTKLENLHRLNFPGNFL